MKLGCCIEVHGGEGLHTGGACTLAGFLKRSFLALDTQPHFFKSCSPLLLTVHSVSSRSFFIDLCYPSPPANYLRDFAAKVVCIRTSRWPSGYCHVVHVFDENDEVDDELINLLVVAFVVGVLRFCANRKNFHHVISPS